MDLISKGKFQFNTEEALKTGLYVSGTPGCGKSDIAMYCVDKLRALGVKCVVVDPSQDWVKRYPCSNIVSFFNGDRVGNYIEKVNLDGMTILDTSHMTIIQIQQFTELFCRLLYKAQIKIPEEKRKFYFILFEEAQTEFPQGIMRAKRMQNVIRLLTQGRNFKIRVGMITQFAATLDKDCLKFSKQRYFGWTDEYNDVKYISNFIGDEAAESLRYFKSGEFLYSFPPQNLLEKIYINPYKAKS